MKTVQLLINQMVKDGRHYTSTDSRKDDNDERTANSLYSGNSLSNRVFSNYALRADERSLYAADAFLEFNWNKRGDERAMNF